MYMPYLQIPPQYICPITEEIMQTPVQIIQCGHVCDSQPLMQQTLDGKSCPCCDNTDLKIRYLPELQKEIRRFCSVNAKALQELKENANKVETTRSSSRPTGLQCSCFG